MRSAISWPSPMVSLVLSPSSSLGEGAVGLQGCDSKEKGKKKDHGQNAFFLCSARPRDLSRRSLVKTLPGGGRWLHGGVQEGGKREKVVPAYFSQHLLRMV